MSEEIVKLLTDNPEWKSAKWRLNNLYWIKDKKGNKTRMTFNWAQTHLYSNMWYLNIILKARQLGMTTMIQIFMLDRCLFNDNTNAGVIAHNREDAESFFTDKLKFAYENLPEEIKQARPATSDSARELSFSNGSRIRVGTSMRSGTLQYLHVSEFGKICAKYPARAQEIIAGALNTVGSGQFVFIESTAEGDGKFKTMFFDAWHSTTERSEMDYKAFFYPWYKEPSYVLDGVVPNPTDPEKDYFEQLEAETGVLLRRNQQAWYLAKWREQGYLMKQEYPSSPAEAFSKMLDGVILQDALNVMRADNRICKVPHRRAPVDTFWDLGRDDKTAIWMGQEADGGFYNMLKYYEYRLVDLSWYAARLQDFARENNWVFGTHYLPHDVANTDLSVSQSRKAILESLGVRPIVVVPRIPSIADGIEMLRGAMSTYRFDEDGCADGIRHLENYQWKEDNEPDAMGNTVFRKEPRKNGADHAADALRQHAQGYRGAESSFQSQMDRHLGGGRRRGSPGFTETAINQSFEHIL